MVSYEEYEKAVKDALKALLKDEPAEHVSWYLDQINYRNAYIDEIAYERDVMGELSLDAAGCAQRFSHAVYLAYPDLPDLSVSIDET